MHPAVDVVDYKSAASQIPQEQIAFADCVSYRESRHNYRAVNLDNENARGRWQFLDEQWRRGLSYMVAKRMVEFGMPKYRMEPLVKHLRSIPIDEWNPVYQDIGFVAALNAKGPWTGWRHWYIPKSKCNSLVPKEAK